MPRSEATYRFYEVSGGMRIRYAIFEPEKAPRGTFLIAPGRREFIERKEAEIGEPLQERGFRVIHFEWLGQGLSDRFLPDAKRQRDHLPDFAIHLQTLRAFYAAVVGPNRTGPLFAAGHSMGAFVILQWLAEDRPDIKAAILSAPMLAVETAPVAPCAAYLASALLVHLGFAASYAKGHHDYDDRDCAFEGNLLTHDPVRFEVIEKYFKKVPDMAVGGVTWGWLHTALKAMYRARHKGYLEGIRAPVLVLNGGDDRVTPASEISRLIRRIPHAEEMLIPGAWHDIFNEADPYRNQAWAQIDRFIERMI